MNINIVPDGTWEKAVFCGRINGTRNSNEAMIRISEGRCNCCLVGLEVGGKKKIQRAWVVCGNAWNVCWLLYEICKGVTDSKAKASAARP